MIKTTKIVPIRVSEDNKAELTVIMKAHDMTIEKKKDFCQVIGLPWEEYERLLRKWSRVITRWEKERGGIGESS